MTENTPSLSYADSGVDIEAGNQLVDAIKPFAQSTKRSGSIGGLGGFGGVFDLKACGYTDPLLISGTDGVGTKAYIANAMDTHDTIGIDLVAMCVNDIIVQGAESLFFLDYLATPKLDVNIASQVIKGIAEGCKQAGCALVGGETAEHPGEHGTSSYDIAGFVVGAVERTHILPRMDAMQEGDIILGLASSGIHSNGFSLVRKIIAHAGADLHSPSPADSSQTLGNHLLTPTRIYVKSLLHLLRTMPETVHGMAHITGGGLSENIPRTLPAHLGAHLDITSWQMPPLFQWLQTHGNVTDTEMRRTFNCGIGMAVIVPANKAQSAAQLLQAQGEAVYTIGTLTKRGACAVTYSDEKGHS